MLTWEKSRTSHHLTRMEKRGLVGREQCPDDARGAFVAITPAGREAIEQAAPGHACTVRRLVFDHLTPDRCASSARCTPGAGAPRRDRAVLTRAV